MDWSFEKLKMINLIMEESLDIQPFEQGHCIGFFMEEWGLARIYLGANKLEDMQSFKL